MGSLPESPHPLCIVEISLADANLTDGASLFGGSSECDHLFCTPCYLPRPHAFNCSGLNVVPKGRHTATPSYGIVARCKKILFWNYIAPHRIQSAEKNIRQDILAQNRNTARTPELDNPITQARNGPFGILCSRHIFAKPLIHVTQPIGHFKSICSISLRLTGYLVTSPAAFYV